MHRAVKCIVKAPVRTSVLRCLFNYGGQCCGSVYGEQRADTVVAGYCAQSAEVKLTGGQETENRQVAHRDARTAVYREPTLT